MLTLCLMSTGRMALSLLLFVFRGCECSACASCPQVQWRNWMHSMPKYEVASDIKFSDILVPTIDTVRSSHIMGMLLTNSKTVSLFTQTSLDTLTPLDSPCMFTV